MDLRSGSMPPENRLPAENRSPAPPGPRRWRVAPGPLGLKIAGTVLLALVAAYAFGVSHDRQQALVAGAAAIGLATFALRDLVAPVRLAAEADGVTVIAGFARRVHLRWSDIEAVRVDVRSRYGLRSEHLEIDAGETLYLFSASDLGARPDEVARALDALRP